MKTWTKLTIASTFLFTLFSGSVLQAEEGLTKTERVKKGNELAFNRKKGNCLACHYIEGGLMGNTGPALVAMKARFPDRDKLRAQIFDARSNNENTIMPPFGAHGALSDEEIELIVDWLLTI